MRYVCYGVVINGVTPKATPNFYIEAVSQEDAWAKVREIVDPFALLRMEAFATPLD